ncbi:uncharacterized protein [Diabrotica undecimpunctata]|uniref:uncharacterized protein isoform X2 n=1 Tax=Diabrotica undecimpunctata TaxID=50387 RepID=UPI003B63A078
MNSNSTDTETDSDSTSEEKQSESEVNQLSKTQERVSSGSFTSCSLYTSKGIPATPATLATPGSSATPATPDTPATVATPDTPATPATPATPTAPATLATTATPDTPDLDDLNEKNNYSESMNSNATDMETDSDSNSEEKQSESDVHQLPKTQERVSSGSFTSCSLYTSKGTPPTPATPDTPATVAIPDTPATPATPATPTTPDSDDLNEKNNYSESMNSNSTDMETDSDSNSEEKQSESDVHQLPKTQERVSSGSFTSCSLYTSKGTPPTPATPDTPATVAIPDTPATPATPDSDDLNEKKNYSESMNSNSTDVETDSDSTSEENQSESDVNQLSKTQERVSSGSFTSCSLYTSKGIPDTPATVATPDTPATPAIPASPAAPATLATTATTATPATPDLYDTNDKDIWNISTTYIESDTDDTSEENKLTESSKLPKTPDIIIYPESEKTSSGSVASGGSSVFRGTPATGVSDTPVTPDIPGVLPVVLKQPMSIKLIHNKLRVFDPPVIFGPSNVKGHLIRRNKNWQDKLNNPDACPYTGKGSNLSEEQRNTLTSNLRAMMESNPRKRKLDDWSQPIASFFSDNPAAVFGNKNI